LAVKKFVIGIKFLGHLACIRHFTLNISM